MRKKGNKELGVRNKAGKEDLRKRWKRTQRRWENVERTRRDKENDSNNALQGVMKRNRGERETSEALKQREGVTADIQRVKPKNVQNERDRTTKTDER